MRRDKSLLYLSLTAVTVIGGYIFLRTAYAAAARIPFAQEFILVVLGTTATVLITAMLLNQQTAVEIEKEQSVKFIELKTRTYEELIARIEELSLMESFGERELTRLRFITHRLAIFASPEVLEEYRRFLETIGDRMRDGSIRQDADAIALALARLTVPIRADLVGEMDVSANRSHAAIRRLILENTEESNDLHIEPDQYRG
jgi:hypothetical protein